MVPRKLRTRTAPRVQTRRHRVDGKDLNDFVNRRCILSLCCVLALAPLPAGAGYGSFGNDNPFVEAMLRMMELFGFIDRRPLPPGVPYLPADRPLGPAFGGLHGLSGYPGMGAWPGAGGVPMNPAISGMPMGWGGQFPSGGFPTGQHPAGMGMPPFQGVPGMPAWGGVPGPGSNPGYAVPAAGLLDGIWELNKGGLLIIKADAARLYVSRERYQDYVIRYDDSYLWWRPHNGNRTSQYRYEVRDGRMILADSKGNLLLLRRRR